MGTAVSIIMLFFVVQIHITRISCSFPHWFATQYKTSRTRTRCAAQLSRNRYLNSFSFRHLLAVEMELNLRKTYSPISDLSCSMISSPKCHEMTLTNSCTWFDIVHRKNAELPRNTSRPSIFTLYGCLTTAINPKWVISLVLCVCVFASMQKDKKNTYHHEHRPPDWLLCPPDSKPGSDKFHHECPTGNIDPQMGENTLFHYPLFVCIKK